MGDAEMAESYRLGEPLSHTIDVLVWHPDVHNLSAQKKRTAELLDALMAVLKDGGYSSTMHSSASDWLVLLATI